MKITVNKKTYHKLISMVPQDETLPRTVLFLLMKYAEKEKPTRGREIEIPDDEVANYVTKMFVEAVGGKVLKKVLKGLVK